MSQNSDTPSTQAKASRDWVKILSAYRDPNTFRSSFELAVTVGVFVLLWAVAWRVMEISAWLTLAISLCNAAFLLRLFAIQHDCGHNAFLKNRVMSDWLGRVIGVVTLTPYDVWRRSHAMHHSSSGNLGRRGMGDVHTLTVAEYQGKSPLGRLLYRLYRHPLVLFGLGPGYLFFLQNRLPLGLTGQAKYWVSSMGTNAVIFFVLSVIFYFGGAMPILLDLERDSVEARADCLGTGADDFWLSEIGPSDLLLRLRLHRTIQQRSGQRPALLELDDLCVDPTNRMVRRGGREVALTAREFMLLQVLLRRRGQVLSRELLLREVWQGERSSSNVVEVYVRYLRQKLEAGGERRLLHTVRGRGYRLGQMLPEA